jgi:pyruvate/2-oxoglutarate dehydrogenase complex dihydrolipoamide dehydrogenase (E3) component
MTNSTKYDAIIIGSGQSGGPLCAALADLGWTVALVEERYLGGTCINTGCTPTKTMVHRAQVAHYARNADRWGVIARDVSVDLPKILAQKDKVVFAARDSKEKQIAKRPKMHLYRSHARFMGPHQVTVDGAILESEKIFIDTGARPRIPKIPGIETSGYLTNETIMELPEVPGHLLIVGAGYIGLEFGQMFARFGSQVTVIEGGGQIVAHEDPEIAAELQRALEAEGINFLLNTNTTAIERAGESVVLSLEVTSDLAGIKKTSSGAVTGSHLLIATGRTPNTDTLGLENAGIATDAHGFIKVNGRLETSVPGVWAMGDVKGGPAFTHISYNDYQIIYANLIEAKNFSIDHRIVPYAVYTDPELGRVGLTEKEARAQGYKLKIGSAPMTKVSRAIERDETAGLMKLVVDATNDQVLGAAILASEGGEVVHILYTLMLGKLPYTLLKGPGSMFIHPTLTEGLFFLMEAVKPVG